MVDADGGAVTGGADNERSDAGSTDISAMLTKSKQEGKKRQMRITGTCFLLGTLGIVLGILVQNYDRSETGEDLNGFVGGALIFISFTVLLLGVLPSDLKAVRVANG